jgi:hypothetical protein
MSSSEEEYDGKLDEEDREDGEEYDDEGGGDDDDDNDGDGGNAHEDKDDDSDDEPLSNLAKPGRKREAAKATKSYTEDSDDDSDDDVPLSSLVANKKAAASPKKNGTKTTNGSATKKQKTVKKAKSSEKEKKKKKKSDGKSTTTAVSSTSSNGKKSFEWASAAMYGTECDKGLLIQRLLCRWWYAMEWPDPSVILKKPPKNHDALDGFPGVYVCTSGESVGKMKDLRNHADKPCFKNFAQKQASELKQLLLKALEEQKKQLVQLEGSNSATVKEIDTLMKWTNKVNPDKADREAAKVLKAQGLL